MLALPFPQIDPVLVQIGPFAIRWYALSYIAGLLLGWWYLVRLLRTESLWQGPPFKGKTPLTPDQAGDLFVWVTLGVILGGRLGYVLFYGLVYNPSHYLENPLNVFAAWEGGMSFHGGVLGVVIALVVFARRAGADLITVGDLVCAVTPIGIFFGRLANFINGELWGKPTSVPWAMVFPHADSQPRHPSQLYEAALEGLLLFAILNVLIYRYGALRKPGLIIATFMACYGLFRIVVEAFFRDSDQLIFGTSFTMGMLLSLFMWAAAGFFYWYALVREPAAASKT